MLFNDLYFPTSCLRDRWARSVGNLKQSLPFCVIHIVMDTNGLIKHAFIVVCSSIWCTDWKVYSSTQYLTSTSELQFFIYRMTLHLDKLVLKSKTLYYSILILNSILVESYLEDKGLVLQTPIGTVSIKLIRSVPSCLAYLCDCDTINRL